MKLTKIICTLGGVLLTTTMISPVMAAKHKPAEMSCEQFMALDDVIKPKVVYWNEGFMYKGKQVDPIVDIEETDQLIPVLITECQKNPKASLKEKIQESKSNKSR
jgi:NAD-dependent SIR2 family protein deacetylase